MKNDKSYIDKTQYQVIIEFSKPDGGYIARVPSLPHCTAYGDTYAEAAREIQDAMKGWIDAAKDTSIPLPKPNGEDIKPVSEFINLTYIARKAKIPEQTLFTKLRRGTPFNKKEAFKIARALNNAGRALTDAGLTIIRKATKATPA